MNGVSSCEIIAKTDLGKNHCRQIELTDVLELSLLISFDLTIS